MNEKEEAQEYRRWRRGKLLSSIGRIFKIGTIMRTDSGGRLQSGDEPPMVELARLAKTGLLDQGPKLRFELEITELILQLFGSLACKDGSVSDEERQFMDRFLKQYGPEELSDEMTEKLNTAFEQGIDDFRQHKNILFLLKRGATRPQVKTIVQEMYHFAYLHGIETEEAREAANIGERLGLPFSELRLAATVARKAADKKSEE